MKPVGLRNAVLNLEAYGRELPFAILEIRLELMAKGFSVRNLRPQDIFQHCVNLRVSTLREGPEGRLSSSRRYSARKNRLSRENEFTSERLDPLPTDIKPGRIGLWIISLSFTFGQ